MGFVRSRVTSAAARKPVFSFLQDGGMACDVLHSTAALCNINAMISIAPLYTLNSTGCYLNKSTAKTKLIEAGDRGEVKKAPEKEKQFKRENYSTFFSIQAV